MFCIWNHTHNILLRPRGCHDTVWAISLFYINLDKLLNIQLPVILDAIALTGMWVYCDDYNHKRIVGSYISSVGAPSTNEPQNSQKFDYKTGYQAKSISNNS